MTRDIEFRGKTKEGEWVYGFASSCEGNAWISTVTKEEQKEGEEEIFRVETIEVLPETVGQWSGLKDKNGVKIFEGDILKGGLWYLSIGVPEGESAGEIELDEYSQVFFENGAFFTETGTDGIILLYHLFSDGEDENKEAKEEGYGDDELPFDVEIKGSIHDNPELLK